MASLQPVSSVPPSLRRSVLYVEDNEVNALLMQALFKRRPDLQLVVATTGEEAMFIARDLQPSLLLLDLRLPDCHGSELLPMLRLLARGEPVPAIAVTADGVFDITGTGFSEIWVKPLDLLQVLRRLDDLLGPVQASPVVPTASASAAMPKGSERSNRGVASMAALLCRA